MPTLRVALGPIRRVGAENVVAEHEAPVRHTLAEDRRLSAQLVLHALAAPMAPIIDSDVAELLLVARHEQEADAGAFDIVGADPPARRRPCA